MNMYVINKHNYIIMIVFMLYVYRQYCIHLAAAGVHTAGCVRVLGYLGLVDC